MPPTYAKQHSEASWATKGKQKSEPRAWLRVCIFSLFLPFYCFIALLNCCPERPLRRSAPSPLLQYDLRSRLQTQRRHSVPVLASNRTLFFASKLLQAAQKKHADFLGRMEGAELVSMATTPQTVSNRRFLKHACSTVVYASEFCFCACYVLGTPRLCTTSVSFSIFDMWV